MPNPLRLGVIGLGRRWRRRYRPALKDLAESFTVVGLYDQVQVRAEPEARTLGCDAAPAVTALLERDDLDAVLLSDPQWFGLWPLELACRLGKPVFCGVPLGLDDAHADALLRQVQEARLPVMVAMPPRYFPATERLRKVLRNFLGTARLVVCDLTLPESARPRSGPGPFPAVGFQGPVLALLDWCAWLLEAEPVRAQATGLEAAGLVSLFWELPGGRAVQMVSRRVPGARPSCRVQVITAQGAATVIFPRRLRWTADGEYVLTLPWGPAAAAVMLQGFAEALRTGREPEPNLAHAHRVLGWLRAAQAAAR